jgi:RNA polymerase sigma factor (sigma-70 family)
MSEPDDLALLREYAAQNSESAFAELVSRRVDFVYSAALRQTQNPHLAEEITQAVFILLAQKAGKISDKTILTGWLFKTTRFTALAQIRAETKRARQQKEFQMQSHLDHTPDDLSRRSEAEAELWNQMSPLLDEALAALGETDRQAVLLRFFENKSLAEVGDFLGIGEDTARKRVSRALEKLHRHFNRRGVSSTTAIIAGAISTNSIHAAPIGLAKTISTIAIAKGAAASTSTLTLVKGTMKMMAWMKLKFVVTVSTVALVIGGLATIALSGEKTQLVPTDPVVFFKRAISSPLDVDSFIAGQRNLQSLEELEQMARLIAQKPAATNKAAQNPPAFRQLAKRMQTEQFYAGARAGSDYYLRYISSPSTPNIPAESEIIIGHAESEFYQVGKNNISYGSGTNAFVASVNATFGLVRQLLDMGLGDIEPKSVVWTGNQFTALNKFGKSRYGELEISNNLPFAINVSEQKGSPVFNRIEYQYPNPPDSLGGFPAKMTMFAASSGEYKPDVEVTLYSVHLANKRLPHDFFSDGQFKTAKIIYTNAYTNSEIWGLIKPLKGKPYFTNLNNVKVVYPKKQDNAN